DAADAPVDEVPLLEPQRERRARVRRPQQEVFDFRAGGDRLTTEEGFQEHRALRLRAQSTRRLNQHREGGLAWIIPTSKPGEWRVGIAPLRVRDESARLFHRPLTGDQHL